MDDRVQQRHPSHEDQPDGMSCTDQRAMVGKKGFTPESVEPSMSIIGSTSIKGAIKWRQGKH
jgi:hypothetical protein